MGSSPTTVTNEDFNGDGTVDLAVSNSGSGNVSILLGNGDGTLQTKTDFPAHDGPTSVTSADFDKDGIADLAVSNFGSNDVSVLLGKDDGTGKGDGTFQTKKDYTVGRSPSSVTSADLNGDGFADLAVANYFSDSVSILLGNGDGTFKPPQNSSINPPCLGFCITATAGPNQVITADFNGDTKLDLATANAGTDPTVCGGIVPCTPGGISVLLGNGDGTFQGAKLPKTNTKIYSIAANGPNLIAAEYDSNAVSVLTSNGNGTFSSGQSYTVGTNPSAVTSADLNGDSVADLAVSNFASDNVSVLWGNGSSSFQAARNFPAGDGPAFVISAKLNADSFADLAIANQNSNDVSVLLNTDDTTAPTVSASPAPGTYTSAQKVTLTASESADIYYTTDGSTPTTSSSKFDAATPINVAQSQTIKALAVDKAGNQSTVASFAYVINIDSTAPTVTAPKHSLIANITKTTSQLRLGTSTTSPPNYVPVKLVWSGQDASGIAKYELLQSTNGAASVSSPLASPTDTSKVVNLEPAKSYRFKVRATDTNGNVSTFAVGSTFTPGVDQESSSRIVDSGTWSTASASGYSGGSVQYASSAGRLATYSVPAGSKNVAWVTTLSTARGRATVTLIENGVRKTPVTVDAYSATTLQRSVVFAQALDPTKTYKVEVKVLGTKSTASTSTRVDVDAFVSTS